MTSLRHALCASASPKTRGIHASCAAHTRDCPRSGGIGTCSTCRARHSAAISVLASSTQQALCASNAREIGPSSTSSAHGRRFSLTIHFDFVEYQLRSSIPCHMHKKVATDNSLRILIIRVIVRLIFAVKSIHLTVVRNSSSTHLAPIENSCTVTHPNVCFKWMLHSILDLHTSNGNR